MPSVSKDVPLVFGGENARRMFERYGIEFFDISDLNMINDKEVFRYINEKLQSVANEHKYVFLSLETIDMYEDDVIVPFKRKVTKYISRTTKLAEHINQTYENMVIFLILPIPTKKIKEDDLQMCVFKKMIQMMVRYYWDVGFFYTFNEKTTYYEEFFLPGGTSYFRPAEECLLKKGRKALAKLRGALLDLCYTDGTTANIGSNYLPKLPLEIKRPILWRLHENNEQHILQRYVVYFKYHQLKCIMLLFNKMFT